MQTFLRYLMAFVMQLAWQRTGKRGALPPMRIPFGKNKGAAMPLPVIGPWQMMVAMWLVKQVWAVYGGQVKNKLQNAANPMVSHIGSLLPDGKSTSPVQSANASNKYQTQPLTSAARTSNSGPLPAGSLLNSLRQTKP